MNSRREKAQKIAWIVSERIAEVTTTGLGRWAPSFVMVSEESDEFMDTLYAWENSGLPEDLEAVEQAGVELVAVWREADRLYRESLTEVPEGVVHGIR